MKKTLLGLIVLGIGVFASAQNDDAVIMTIDGRPIMKSEFEYIYFKNNPNATVDQNALNEYMELYKKFKLKVTEAEALGYDTLPAFKGELKSYRSQLAKPYLTDQNLEEALYQEAYSHLLEDVEVSHILIRLPQQPTEGDTLMAYKRAMEAYNRLKAEPFEKVAKEVSDDQSVKKNNGYLGFFTGLMAVWPFEKAMYDLEVGEISTPIRTPYGYHIVKVHSRRPARGQIAARHIMKISNQQMSPAEQEKAYRDIVAIATRLDQGEDFETLARQLSDDKGSAAKGGDLSWFGIGRMVKEFEDAAFELPVGSVSKPIKTQFGWHLIKVYDKRGIEPFEKKRAEIQRAMQYDERSTAARESFINNLKKEYNYELNPMAVLEIKNFVAANPGVDSTVLENSKTLDGVLFSFADVEISKQDFIKFYVITGANSDVEARINQLSEMELSRYEEAHLESKYRNFALLMQEYHDGILLFDISNRQVWDKANRDVEGLDKYFKENRSKYNWDTPRYKGFIVRCKDEATAKLAKSLIKKIPADSVESYFAKRINNDSVKVVLVERGLWKQGDNATIDAKVYKDKAAVQPEFKDYPVYFVSGKLLKKGPEDYKDVRGAVTADYQNLLEEQWLEYLQNKYTVVVNQDVLNSLVRP